MTREEKLKAIEDMGIEWEDDCPSQHKLLNTDECYVYTMNDVQEKCIDCWINALEATP